MTNNLKLNSIIFFFLVTNNGFIANKSNCTSTNIEKNEFKERPTNPTEHQTTKYFQIHSI